MSLYCFAAEETPTAPVEIEVHSTDGLISSETVAAEGDAGDLDTDKEEEQEALPEKLADEDERKEKWYRRAFYTVFPKLRRGMCL